MLELRPGEQVRIVDKENKGNRIGTIIEIIPGAHQTVQDSVRRYYVRIEPGVVKDVSEFDLEKIGD